MAAVHASSVRRAPWLLAAVLTLEVVAFMPALVQPGVMRAPIAKASDGTGQVYPWRIFWRDEVKAGRAPLWNPYVFAGTPAVGEPQTQTLYPANLLWLWLRPDMAFTTTLVLHVLLASLLMYGLVREMGASEAGAAVAALAFGLHGQMIIFSFAGWQQMVAPMAWAPGVLWALARAFGHTGSRGRRAIAAGGIALGVQVLSGHPEWVRYTLLCGLLLVLFTSGAASLRRRATVGIAILALGTLIGAPQLLPTLEAAARSSRGKSALAEGPALHGAALPVLTLPTVVAPRLFGPWDLHVSTDGAIHKSRNARISFGESLIYVGVLPLALALAAAARGQPAARPWIAIGIAGLLFALNDITHVQCAFDRIVRPDAVFRSPGRFVFMTNLALAVLAGLGMSRLEVAPPGQRLVKGALIAGAAMIAAAAVMFAFRSSLASFVAARINLPTELLARGAAGYDSVAGIVWWAVGGAAGQMALAAGLIILSALAVAWFARAPGMGRALAVLVVVAVDLGATARPFLASVVRTDELYAPDRATLGLLARIPGARFDATPEVFDSGPNVAILSRVRALPGYDTFLLPEWERLNQASRGWNPDVLEAIGVTHTLTRAGRENVAVAALPSARGRAWWTGAATFAGDADGAAALLTTGARVESVALETGAPAARAGADTQGTASATRVEIERDVAGHFRARVTAPSAGWLVVTEVFYPGWRAHVNGARVEVQRAFGAIQAVRVPAGASTVDVRYRPASLWWGLACGALGAVLAAALLLWRRRV